MILTHKSGATVYRWATKGPKRIRAKYQHARTLCGIVNPRHGGPILAMGDVFGAVGSAKMFWGTWPVRLRIGTTDMEVQNLRALRQAVEEATDLKCSSTSMAGDSQMSKEACHPRRSRCFCDVCRTPLQSRKEFYCAPCQEQMRKKEQQAEEAELKAYYLRRLLVQARLRDSRLCPPTSST